ncbi:hypothetical protein L3N51_02427 [Metallosphaera sp. J1]|uniref:DUF1404 domain-containing protein n=1 Tax=Metallosphaera TaxID=41980 RepID=UPI001EDE4750|nr:DUF1404 domain-containing protein [Metallosphaera javensis (ex Hofmann et al. 2022)]MCG3110130.1 hypothetical protein [Metallosphaera javensis (ex Hofmann et al. 2022)]BCS92609.1 MAG: hypothetical protein MjAS7_1217 [Metallosphaera javensis (ex Sakai et al. 2022)]
MFSYQGVKRSEYKFLIIPAVTLVAFLNPVTEGLQFSNPVVFMLDHYAMFFAGSVIGYKMFRGSLASLVMGAIIAVFWHFPLPFDLAATNIAIRLICEATLFLGGILAGSYIPKMSLTVKITSLALYMLGDTFLSILFIIGNPLYTNVDFPSMQWGPSSLPLVGIVMFVVMNLVLVYTIARMMRNMSIF